MTISIRLQRQFFADSQQVLLEGDGLKATLFRYPTGIEAIRVENRRGHLVVLPYLGQMVWDAMFDGVDLTMRNMFKAPRPARTIVETYGCFAFHSGLLRNGVPGAEDDHAPHGEMPTATMDEAGLEMSEDERGCYLAVTGSCEYAMGFGAHYLASPRIVLRADDTLFDIVMEVRNLSGAAMDLMYMVHVNFALCPGGRIVQPTGLGPDQTVVRQAVPAHVHADPAYLAFIGELARDPSASAVMDRPERFDPEQVFYICGLRTDAEGQTRVMMRRTERDGFAIAYDPTAFPHTVRWIMANSDQAVCAFALPSTCEPEGYTAEARKGNVRKLAGGETARFEVTLGYLDEAAAARAEASINGL